MSAYLGTVSVSIKKALYRNYSTVDLLAKGTSVLGSIEDAVKALFANDKQGVWYDPSDKSTLFQDVAGTIPVTKDGDPVALMIDKSQGITVGGELVINSNFDMGTSNWVNGRPEHLSFSVSNGIATTSTTSSYTQSEIKQDIATVIGKTYILSSYVKAIAPYGYNLRAGASSSVFFADGKWKRIQLIFTAVSTTTTISIRTSNGTENGWQSGTLEISNISVIQIVGNHAKQTASAARPIYKTDGILHWLEFDGVNDYMETANFGLAQPVSMALAMSFGSESIKSLIDGLTINSGSITIRGLALRLYSVGGDDASYYPPLITLNKNHIYDARLSGSTSYVTFDNNPIIIRPTGTTTMGGITIGALAGATSGSAFGGRCYGTLVVADNISTDVRQSVKRYLANKAGVTL